jgi:O-antigen/teichoic acid export membrane protein
MESALDEAGPRRLFGRATIVAAGTGYHQGISFLSGLIVARVIGASEYGIFSLARSLVEVTGILTRLGLERGLQRFFGETSAGCNSALRAVVLRQVRTLAGTLALLPVAAIAVGLGHVLEQHVYPYHRFAEVLLCLALALPFTTDLAVLGGAYRGVLKLPPAVLADCVLLPTIRLATIVVLFLAGWRLWAVVAGTVLASLVAWAFLALRARVDFRGDADAPAQPRSWDEAFRVVGYSSVLAITLLVATLTASMDVLMLGHFTTAADVGQYSLVKMLLLLMGVCATAFTTGLGALVAERHFRGDLDGMVRVISVSTRWIALVTVPVFAIFLFWGAQLTQLFGPSFAVSQSVVSWLAASQFVFVIFGTAGWALSMTGRHMLELKIMSAALVLATFLCWIAIPLFGQLGAAVAMCTSWALANLARALVVRHSSGAFPFGREIVLIAAAGIALAWASSAMIAQFSSPSLWSAASGIGCFAATYAVIAWAYFLEDDERTEIRAATTGRFRAAAHGR